MDPFSFSPDTGRCSPVPCFAGCRRSNRAALLYALVPDAWTGWLLLAAVYLLLLSLETVLIAGAGALERWVTRALLAAVAGVIPVAIVQMESHFADEEFFAAL